MKTSLSSHDTQLDVEDAVEWSGVEWIDVAMHSAFIHHPQRTGLAGRMQLRQLGQQIFLPGPKQETGDTALNACMFKGGSPSCLGVWALSLARCLTCPSLLPSLLPSPSPLSPSLEHISNISPPG